MFSDSGTIVQYAGTTKEEDSGCLSKESWPSTSAEAWPSTSSLGSEEVKRYESDHELLGNAVYVTRINKSRRTPVTRTREIVWCMITFLFGITCPMQYGLLWAAAPDVMLDLDHRDLSAAPIAIFFAGFLIGGMVNMSRYAPRPFIKRLMIYASITMGYMFAFIYAEGVYFFLAAIFCAGWANAVSHAHAFEVLFLYPKSVWGSYLLGYGSAIFMGPSLWSVFRSFWYIQTSLILVCVLAVPCVILCLETLVYQSKKYLQPQPEEEVPAPEVDISISSALRSTGRKTIIYLACLGGFNAGVANIFLLSMTLVVQTYCSYAPDSFIGEPNENHAAMRALGICVAGFGIGQAIGRWYASRRLPSTAVHITCTLLQVLMVVVLTVDARYHMFLRVTGAAGYWMFAFICFLNGLLYGYVDSACHRWFFNTPSISRGHAEAGFSLQLSIHAVTAITTSFLSLYFVNGPLNFNMLYPGGKCPANF